MHLPYTRKMPQKYADGTANSVDSDQANVPVAAGIVSALFYWAFLFENKIFAL